MVRSLAELRHKCCQSTEEVLSEAVLPVEHRFAGSLQLGPHVLGLQQPELQEGRARLGPDSAGPAERRDPAETHAHKSLQQLVPRAHSRLAPGRNASVLFPRIHIFFTTLSLSFIRL